MASKTCKISPIMGTCIFCQASPSFVVYAHAVLWLSKFCFPSAPFVPTFFSLNRPADWHWLLLFFWNNLFNISMVYMKLIWHEFIGFDEPWLKIDYHLWYCCMLSLALCYSYVYCWLEGLLNSSTTLNVFQLRATILPHFEVSCNSAYLMFLSAHCPFSVQIYYVGGSQN